MSDTKQRPKRAGTSLFIILPLGLLLTACGQKYSPDTYSSSAVQQASKVESGVVVGVRKVVIRADPTIASATGAAAGGIAGSQVAEGAYSALGALGGAVVGGIAGSEAGHKIQDTDGYEYIVRNAKGDLLSVTQKDVTPLKIGQRVLLIQGSQARIVNDYTEHVEDDFAAQNGKEKSSADGKTDMSKAAQGDSKAPAPAAQTETEKMINAATVAAIAAITAKGVVDAQDQSQAGASPATAADSATAKTTTDAPAQAETPAPAAAETTQAAPVSKEKNHTATAKPDVQPGAPTQISPITGAPGPNEQPTPAPATTKIVPVPSETAADTAMPAADTAAPAEKAAGKPDASDKPVASDKATASDKAKASGDKDAKNEDGTTKEGDAEATRPDAETSDTAEPAAPAPAPAVKDEGAAQ